LAADKKLSTAKIYIKYTILAVDRKCQFEQKFLKSDGLTDTEIKFAALFLKVIG
jgi:hypothetical protein